MKPLVQLVTEWSAYEENHPDADIAGFCHYLLAKPGVKKAHSPVEKGMLARVIGRISGAYALYHRAAMEEVELPAPESFYYLNSLHQLGEVKKMELINYLFAETTTGMEAINKLLRAGLVKERPDPGDGRARLIKVTDKGKKKLAECTAVGGKVNEMIFKKLDDETIALCIQLLTEVERTHSVLAIELKNKPFATMYNEVMRKG